MSNDMSELKFICKGIIVNELRRNGNGIQLELYLKGIINAINCNYWCLAQANIIYTFVSYQMNTLKTL